MIDWAQVLTIANLIILVTVTVGGYIALKSAVARAEIGVQTRVREALSAENELLQGRVERLEKEKKQLESQMQLIITMLKKMHHIEIEVDGEVLTMRSQNGTHVSRISTNTP